MSNENRLRLRVEIPKLAFAKNATTSNGGILSNISSTGAAIRFFYPLGKADHSFEVGNTIEMEIDGFGSLNGKVVRIENESIAVEFNSSDEQEAINIANIMLVENHIE